MCGHCDRAWLFKGERFSCNEAYITLGRHSEVLLTDIGQAQAEKVYETHRIDMDLLMRLGADETLAEENARLNAAMDKLTDKQYHVLWSTPWMDSLMRKLR